MATHIEAYVSSCEHCQRNKNYTANTRGIPTPMTTPLRRFDVVALDILTFGKQCKNGFDSVVVFTDRLSKRAYISPCYKTATAADLARIFFDTVFRNQGMPRVLLSDNGPQFHSDFWTEFFALLRTEVRLTSTYHPQSNGGSEKFNKTLLEALRSYVSARQDDWDTYLVYIEFAYNNSVNAATGFSPFVLQFAQSPRAPWDLFNATEPDEMHRGNSNLASSLGLDIITNITAARDALHKAAQDFRLRHAAVCKPHSYKVGDAVLLSTKNLKLKLPCRKLSPAFIGPFRIQQLRGSNAVILEFTGRWKHLHTVVNIEYLRPYSLRSDTVGPGPQSSSVKPISVEPDGSSWYQIAEILDHNGPSGPKCRCLVRWEGFDATHDSWILRKHVTLEAITAYEQILTDMAADSGTTADKVKLATFIGKQGQFSALAERARLQAHNIQRAQRAVALEASVRDNTQGISEVPDVPALPGRRRTKVPQRFKPS